jgi:hypothetical protein
MGRPHELTPLQSEALKLASHPQFMVERTRSENGPTRIHFELEPGEVELVEIAPEGETAHNRNYYSEEVAAWNSALGEAGAL